MRDTIKIQKDNITYYINASKGTVVARMPYPVVKGKVIRGFKEKEYYMYNYLADGIENYERKHAYNSQSYIEAKTVIHDIDKNPNKDFAKEGMEIARIKLMKKYYKVREELLQSIKYEIESGLTSTLKNINYSIARSEEQRDMYSEEFQKYL